EAAYLATLAHPGLIKIFDVGVHHGLPYIVMEYINGQNLGSELEAAPLPILRVIALARSVAETLDAVARRGVVHRDLKPQNILLAEDGRIKVIDFGLAAIVDELTAETTDRTCGTCLYASPEQTGMLRRPVDGRSDLYSLGAVLYHCLAGSPPFLGTTAAELIHLHAAATPPDLCERNPAVSRALAEIVDRLLAKDPEQRFQSGREVVAALDSLDPHAPQKPRHVVPATRQTDPILCARTSEYTRLARTFSGARPPSMGLLGGPSGSGARVVARALAMEIAAERGGDCIYGVCTLDANHPHRAIADALDAYLSGDSPQRDARRERVAQSLRSRVGNQKQGPPSIGIGPLLAPL
ncbi:MAG: serine/threonine-protein kinase, partial [Nannocystaceae bacterium]